MIPILYESYETAFTSNGLGRLRDCITCVVTEERNGIYECDFSYPITGSNYSEIKLGRIIAVEHDDSDDVQPFDIVSCSRPINGVVEFHCVHISYRQRFMTVSGTNINTLEDALEKLGTAQPINPFSYETDKTSTGYVAAFDGAPKSVRSILGGVEGSILDAYGGEYEWDKWRVILHSARGRERNFTIRYGVNLLDYSEELDYSESYTSVIPYWQDENTGTVVKGSLISSGATPYNGIDACVPLDLSDKFENQPTASGLNTMAASYLSSNQPYLPAQSIEVDFVRLQDSAEYAHLAPLLECSLCDTIKVIMSMYGMNGTFKIVRTEYDVLLERFISMELGTLSTTLSEALGISSESDGKGSNVPVKDYVVEEASLSTGCKYRKWNSGKAEAWYTTSAESGVTTTAWTSPIFYGDYTSWASVFSGVFDSAPAVTCTSNNSQFISVIPYGITSNGVGTMRFISVGAKSNVAYSFSLYAVGTWS